MGKCEMSPNLLAYSMQLDALSPANCHHPDLMNLSFLLCSIFCITSSPGRYTVAYCWLTPCDIFLTWVICSPHLYTFGHLTSLGVLNASSLFFLSSILEVLPTALF